MISLSRTFVKIIAQNAKLFKVKFIGDCDISGYCFDFCLMSIRQLRFVYLFVPILI